MGFKWFVDGLIDGSFGFAGEESAGASFLRRDGSVWTTDKDGLIPGLLAAEITARTGRDPGEAFNDLTQELGVPFYERIDAPATAEQKALLKAVSPEQIGMKELAGEPIRAKLTIAPGNSAAFGGIKVIAENGWFAARPSGTEDVYKIYAESFRSEDHLRQIQQAAQDAIPDCSGGKACIGPEPGKRDWSSGLRKARKTRRAYPGNAAAMVPVCPDVPTLALGARPELSLRAQRCNLLAISDQCSQETASLR